jgi:Arc/MetJ family transcription regulator
VELQAMGGRGALDRLLVAEAILTMELDTMKSTASLLMARLLEVSSRWRFNN